MRTRLSAAASLVAMLMATGAVLHLSGREALVGPALTSPQEWSRWFGHTNPVSVAFTIVRLVASGLWWYLGVVSIARLGAGLLPGRRAVATIDRFAIPPLRRLLVTVATGVSLSLPGPALAQVPTTQAPERATLTMRSLPATAETGARVTTEGTPPESTKVAPSSGGEGVARATQETAAAPGTWTVVAGESFWSRAEQAASTTVEGRGPRHPSDTEIGDYWIALIEANRSRLADPSNPDLIFPGQSFVLP